MFNSKYNKIKFGKYFKENKGIYNNINIIKMKVKIIYFVVYLV